MGMDNQVVLTSFVYEMDALVVVLELQAAGIDAVIQKDDCGGMRPWITNERGIEVLVPAAELEQARLVLSEHERVKTEKEVPVAAKERTGGGCASFAFVLLVGLAAGYVMAHLVNYFQTGRVKLVGNSYSADRNGDGKADIIYLYDKGNVYIGGKSDDNFDGKWDSWWKSEGDVQLESTADTDFNGVVDATTTYSNSVACQTDFRPNGSESLTRRELHRNGVFFKELIDTNGDGTLDLETEYDAFVDETYSGPIRK
jgi:hypothetical protein